MRAVPVGLIASCARWADCKVCAGRTAHHKPWQGDAKALPRAPPRMWYDRRIEPVPTTKRRRLIPLGGRALRPVQDLTLTTVVADGARPKGIRRPWNPRHGFVHGDDQRAFLPSGHQINRLPVECRQRSAAGSHVQFPPPAQ